MKVGSLARIKPNLEKRGFDYSRRPAYISHPEHFVGRLGFIVKDYFSCEGVYYLMFCDEKAKFSYQWKDPEYMLKIRIDREDDIEVISESR